MKTPGITTADLPKTVIQDALQTPLRERRRASEKALEQLISSGENYPMIGSAKDRASQFQSNFQKGYAVLKRDALLNPDLRYSNKRGPWVEFLADADLRLLGESIANPRLPLTSKDITYGIVVPGQSVGIRFGVRSLNRYEALWIDLLNAELMAQAIRKRGRPVSAEAGAVKVDYGDGIVLTAYGFKKDQATEITAQLDGYPSRGDEAKKHSTSYKLETIAESAPKGYFSITSGFAPHRAWNRDVLISYNGNISKHTPETNKTATIKRIPVYEGDLIGLYLLEAIARKRFKVQLNQPLPSFSAEHRALMSMIAGSTIIVSPDGKRSKPNKTQASQLYSIALGRF